jgi:hypothetical protein
MDVKKKEKGSFLQSRRNASTANEYKLLILFNKIKEKDEVKMPRRLFLCEKSYPPQYPPNF